MDIPTLPVFDEFEEPELGQPWYVSGGRVAVFLASVMVARHVKNLFWEDEVGVIRRMWLNRPKGLVKAATAVIFCLLMNVLTAAVLVYSQIPVKTDNHLPLLDVDQNMGSILSVFVVSQLVAVYLRLAPDSFGEYLQRLKSIPVPCRRFTLFLDVIGVFCVLPVIACLIYDQAVDDPRLLSPGILMFLTVLSTVAVLLPRPVKRNAGGATPLLPANRPIPPVRDPTTEIGQFDECPLNLVIRKRCSKDSLPLDTPQVCGLESTSSAEEFADDSRPALMINAEGCSPALISRLRQMGDLKARNLPSERRASLRSHQTYSSPDLTELSTDTDVV